MLFRLIVQTKPSALWVHLYLIFFIACQPQSTPELRISLVFHFDTKKSCQFSCVAEAPLKNAKLQAV